MVDGIVIAVVEVGGLNDAMMREIEDVVEGGIIFPFRRIV